MFPSIWSRRFDKPLLFVACLVPLAGMIADALGNQLGANPVEALSHRTGDWTLRFLLVTLAVTPLNKRFGWSRLVPLRRMLGLYAFFYASVHFLVYLVLDRSLLLPEILTDVAKRPYITVGFAVWLMLVPLAITSNNAMIRRLGGKRWKQLHRLVYACGVGGVLHYIWLVKSDITEPLMYGAILAVLLLSRMKPVGKLTGISSPPH